MEFITDRPICKDCTDKKGCKLKPFIHPLHCIHKNIRKGSKMKTEKSSRTQKEKDFDIAAEKRMRKQVEKSEKYDRQHGLNGY